MKKYISVLALSATLFCSCSDFLDVQREGDPLTNAYFTNDQQAIDAIDGLYKPFHSETLFSRDLFWEQGAACDVVWGRSRGFNTLGTMAYTGDEDPLKNAFESLYQNISRSNWIIQQLVRKEKEKGLSAIEKRSLGEAYFLRGFAHFYVAYRYGTDKQGVPFMRYEDLPGDYDYSIPPQQKSVVDNYKYIIADMDQAIKYLPKFEEYDTADRGRAHQAAAVAYKAKVYAYWAAWDETQWDNVIAMVNSLETEYGRDLNPSFSQLFSSEYADFWTKEYLWTIPSDGGTIGGGVDFPGVVLENKGWGKYNGWGQLKPTLDIYEEMAKDGEGNERLTRSILEYNQEFQYFGETMRFYSTSDFEAGFMINKYMDPFKHKDPEENGYVNTNGDWPTARINFPIMRFAEMKLFRAEAYLMKGQPENAKKDLNDIHYRATGTADRYQTPTMADLYHERRCELAFEFTDHLFDLKRWAQSSNSEIKELALKELNARPRIRRYEHREDPASALLIYQDTDGDGIPDPFYYGDYALNKQPYKEHMRVFPYPAEQVKKSNGQLHQNEGY